MPEKIIILLSTYNGAKYIGQQLDSVLKQSYTNWELLVRDDGSVDETVNILHEYQLKDSRIKYLKDDKGNLGAPQSFGCLLQYALGEQYIMFCDQDDVWIPEKIEITLNKMLLTEQHFSIDEPLLIHTNFIYVYSDLKPVKTKKNFRATKIEALSLNHLLAQNPAYGCTMMLNKKLANLVNSIPDIAENHDYWVALVAIAFGKIIYIKQPTVFYRQHNNNVSGNHDNDTVKKRINRILYKGNNFKDAYLKVLMCIEFKRRYFNRLSAPQQKLINDFLCFSSTKKIKFLLRTIQNGVRRQTLSQTLLFYVSVLFLNKKKIPRFE